MTFKKQGIPLSDIVFGFGTASRPSGFSGVQLDSGFTFVGSPLYFVPKNTTFMPFVDMSLDEFTVAGSAVLAPNSFATVNRFITSNSVRLIKTSSSGKVTVYYRGNVDPSKRSPNSLGILSVGGVELACPPVICVVLQGAGGNGGSGFNSDIITRYNAADLS